MSNNSNSSSTATNATSEQATASSSSSSSTTTTTTADAATATTSATATTTTSTTTVATLTMTQKKKKSLHPSAFIDQDFVDSLLDFWYQRGINVRKPYKRFEDIEDPPGETPLLEAISNGDLEKAFILLHHRDINIEERNMDERHLGKSDEYFEGTMMTPQLRRTTKHGPLKIWRLLDKYFEGMTPLLWTAKHGDLDILRLLLDYGANINARSRDRRTVLHFAGQNGHEHLVEYLLNEMDFDMYLKDRKGRTSFDCAFFYGSVNVPIADMLLDKGYDLDKSADRILDLASLVREITRHTKIRRRQRMKHLMNRPEMRQIISNPMSRISISLNTTEGQHDYFTPTLRVAASTGDLELVQFILNHCGNINVDTIVDGETAILAASRSGHFDVVKLLFEHGADINITSGEALSSPLHCAIERGHDLIAEWLIIKGADISIPNSDGQSPVDLVISHKNVYLLRYAGVNVYEMTQQNPLISCANRGWYEGFVCLFDGGGDVMLKNLDSQTQDDLRSTYGEGLQTMLDAAIRNSNERVVISLLRITDVNYCDKNGMFPLKVAVESGNKYFVQLLLHSGADPNFQNDDGVTALFTVKDAEVASTLLLHGGANLNVNVQDSMGNTALHRAVIKPDVVKVLLDYDGIDFNLKRNDGTTALHTAVANNLESSVRYLVEHGACCNVQDNNGRTPLHCAVTFASRTLVYLLLDHGSDVSLSDNLEWKAVDYVKARLERGTSQKTGEDAAIIELLTNAESNS